MSLTGLMDKQNVVYPYNGLLLSHKKALVNLTNIMLSQRSQSQRPHILRFHLHEMPRTGKPIETESRLVAAGSWGHGGMGSG